MNYTDDDVDYAIKLAQITFNKVWKNLSSTDFLDREALESAAYNGAWRALETYDGSKGASLRTWIIRRIRFSISREIQENTYAGKYYDAKFRKMAQNGEEVPEWGKAPVSLDEPVTVDGDEETLFVDVLKDRRVDIERQVTEQNPIQCALLKLPPRSREMIHAYYWRGEVQREIAARYGITKPAVDRDLRVARSQLRKYLAEAGFEHD